MEPADIGDTGPSSLIVNVGSVDSSLLPDRVRIGYGIEEPLEISEPGSPDRKDSESSDSGSGSSTLASTATDDIRVTLVWRNLSVFIPIRKPGILPRLSKETEYKQVLNKATGIVRPGSLVAVMGASGAGKTTLLNVLANKTLGKFSIDGVILANGIRVGKFMGHASGYVYQQDLFYGALTVAEHMHFMAILKLDRKMTRLDREQRIEELLVELGLKKAENTRIGVPGVISGLSGGERKRLAFATEIITEPPVLFLDECTTGLDSFSAQRVVGIMQGLAAKGKTILCTIQQPTSQVFAMFDQLCLLADGRTAYMGKALDALPFLERIGYVCPEQFNPAEFLIKTLAVVPGKENESVMKIHEICDEFAKSKTGLELANKVRREIKSSKYLDLSTSSDEAFGAQYIHRKQLYPPTWTTKTRWLIWRSFIDTYRNPKVLMPVFFRTATQVLVALCFSRISLSQEAVQDVQGALYMMMVGSSFSVVYGVLNVFPMQLPLFHRENQAGMYSVSSYYLSTVIATLPRQVLDPLVNTTIFYWMVGLRSTASAYGYTALIIIMVSNTSAAIGYWFSILFDKVDTASMSMNPVDFILQLTSGIFINLRSLPVYFAWMQYISWFKYGNEAISIAQWDGIENIACPVNYNETCLTTGDEVLASKSFDTQHWTEDFIGITIIYIWLHMLAYISLQYRTKWK